VKVGWLADVVEGVGGAELTQAELRAAAPDGVEVIDCPPGAVVIGLDAYAIHNCVDYRPADLRAIGGKPAVKYWNDVGPWLDPDVRVMLGAARSVCCSPLQADHMGIIDAAQLIPPPVDLDRFEAAAASVNGDRAGSVCVASWRNLGKGAALAAEWGIEHGGLDFYGPGPLAPQGAVPWPYDQMPDLLAHYQRFVFLPTVIEPFGRLVIEAWAAGCEIVTNDLVGAKWWIESGHIDRVRTAGRDYWDFVLNA
jgi:glycosyltransferase involved in cell wall biosynthesis